MKFSMILFIISTLLVEFTLAKNVIFIHWNKHSPMFRIDNTDHIVDVQEFDQVNLICPRTSSSSDVPERHIVYSVSEEEYKSCRITNPRPKIVAVCNRPHQAVFYTITFRSFTPQPGGLEFEPGRDYYFISTASRRDLHRRMGGGCASHNMKMIFKLGSGKSDAQDESTNNAIEDEKLLPETSSAVDDDDIRLNLISNDKIATTYSTMHPKIRGISTTEEFRRNRGISNTIQTPTERPDVFYYHPRDVIGQKSRTHREEFLNNEQSVQSDSSSSFENSLSQFWRRAALPFTSSTSSSRSTNFYCNWQISVLALLISIGFTLKR